MRLTQSKAKESLAADKNKTHRDAKAETLHDELSLTGTKSCGRQTMQQLIPRASKYSAVMNDGRLFQRLQKL